jgi:hypothetical protein
MTVTTGRGKVPSGRAQYRDKSRYDRRRFKEESF